MTSQPSYNDECLEADEWLGLTLGVDVSSVDTIVKPMYDQTSIIIQDRDSELCFKSLTEQCMIYFLLIISSGCGWSGADILQCLRECGSSGIVCYCNIT